MSREKFYQDVRSAWRRVRRRPSARIEGAGESIPIRELGLAPLTSYRKKDFEGLSPDLQKTLDDAVRSFQTFSRGLARDQPVPDEAFSEGFRRLEGIAVPLRQIILDEWKAAEETLIANVEEWSKEKDWRFRRDPKTISESLLQEYTLPLLRVYVDTAYIHIEPVCRFVTGAFGLVEISLIPSYESLKVILTEDGWKILIPSTSPREENSLLDWNKSSFESAVGYLTNLPV